MDEIIVVNEPGEGFYEEKKSKFLARLYSVNSEAEAALFVEADRKKYWDARHNCYAYVIGDNNEITKCSDDGEPSQTAGKPILEVILGNSLHNCLIVVTRYFGGTLLGTGGLVRAYQKAARLAVDNSTFFKLTKGCRYIVETDYNGYGKLQYNASVLNYSIVNTEYTDRVTAIVEMKKEAEGAFIKKVTEITNGRATLIKDCDLPVKEAYVN